MRRALVVAAAVVLAATTTQAVAAAPPVRWAVCGTWRYVPVPDPSAIGDLFDVAVVSPEEAWAVGMLGAEQPTGSLILHWTGMRWERVTFPKVAFLQAVTVVSPSEVWVVGQRSGGMGARGHPFTARWTGERWESVPIGASILGWLQDVTAVPGTRQLWAVGATNRGHPLTLHWTGRTWRRMPTNLLHSTLSGVVAFPHAVWAVGSAVSGTRMLALRWNGARWNRIAAPHGYAAAIDGVRPDRLWAVGGVPSGRGGYSRPAAFHWNGQEWHRAWAGSSIGGLHDVVAPAPGVMWGVGSRASTPPYHPLIVRRRSDGWDAMTVRGGEGFLWAIDGTPNNLWLTHSYMVDPHGSEPAYFDTYHRC